MLSRVEIKVKRFLAHESLLVMEMRFCPNCGKKLALTRVAQSVETSFEYRCPECGYVEENSPIPREIKTTRSNTLNETIVVIGEEGKELRTMPMIKAECPNCENDQAYVWQVQTRSGDEGPTQFFRCTKCNQTWRRYT